MAAVKEELAELARQTDAVNLERTALNTEAAEDASRWALSGPQFMPARAAFHAKRKARKLELEERASALAAKVRLVRVELHEAAQAENAATHAPRDRAMKILLRAVVDAHESGGDLGPLVAEARWWLEFPEVGGLEFRRREGLIDRLALGQRALRRSLRGAS